MAFAKADAKMRKALSATLAACMLVIAVSGRSADTYPSKSIRLIVPWPPGGPADSYARALADPLRKQLGQSVFIDNRPGASGTLGAALAAGTKPDGYTLLYGCQTDQVVAPASMNLPYDPARDFVPITQVVEAPFILVAHPGLRSLTPKELIARARSESLIYASPGTASVAHFLGELLKRTAEIDLLHVPYKGQAALLPDLLSGRVHLSFMMQSTVAEHVHAGKLIAILVTSGKKLESMPNVPTAMEAGLKPLQATFWCGLLAPAGTSPAIISLLSKAAKTTLEKPEVVDAMRKSGAQIVAGGPEAFSAMLKAERERWTQIIKTTGIRGE